MVHFGKVQNLQGTENAMQEKIKLNLQGKQIARNGIWREMEAVITTTTTTAAYPFFNTGSALMADDIGSNSDLLLLSLPPQLQAELL